MEKLLGTGSTRALSNSTQRAATSFARLTGPLFHHERKIANGRSLKQSTRIGCLNGSWSSTRLIVPHIRRSSSCASEPQQRGQVKCSSAAEAFGSVHEVGASSRGYGAGIVKDIERKLIPHNVSDFTDGLHPKALSATAYMIFASLTPCFAFGGMIARVTASQMGLLETIISCAASGLIYTSLAVQLLTLLGPTGFIVVIIGACTGNLVVHLSSLSGSFGGQLRGSRELRVCTDPPALILLRLPCYRLFWRLEPMQLPKF